MTQSPENMSHLLFIQISEKSYDEIYLIDRLVSQWSKSHPETSVYSLTNGVSSAFISSRPERVVGVLAENQEENLQRFEVLKNDLELDAIVILDLHEYFIRPMDLNFLPVWLEDVKCPVYALDYFNLIEYKEGVLHLKQDVELDQFEEGEAPLPLQLQVEILKPVLPNLPDAFKNEPHTRAWNATYPELGIQSPQNRREILESIEAKENDFIVTVLFDPALFSQALERNLIGFYFVLVEVLIFYFSQMRGQRFQLFIFGSAPPTPEINMHADLNVDIHYFTHLTEDNYAAFIGASDLIISNSDWAVALLDAMQLKTPVCVFGNSVIQEWKDDTETEKELRAPFQPLKPLYDLCQLMLDLNQFSITTPIYQFISYPLRDSNPDFPIPGLQQKTFPYFLMDMFDDQSTLFMLRHLLLSAETNEKHSKLCDDLLAVTEDSLTFNRIHEAVMTSEEIEEESYE